MYSGLNTQTARGESATDEPHLRLAQDATPKEVGIAWCHPEANPELREALTRFVEETRRRLEETGIIPNLVDPDNVVANRDNNIRLVDPEDAARVLSDKEFYSDLPRDWYEWVGHGAIPRVFVEEGLPEGFVEGGMAKGDESLAVLRDLDRRLRRFRLDLQLGRDNGVSEIQIRARRVELELMEDPLLHSRSPYPAYCGGC